MEEVRQLKQVLEELGIQVVESPCLTSDQLYPAGEGKKRAEILNGFFRDPSVSMIFDVSGGDLANEVLPFLDYQAIAESDKTFWGYSDLTTVLNGIYAKTGRSSVLYQIRNLVRDRTGQQTERFRRFLKGEEELFQPEWTVLQGEGRPEELIRQHGVIGGNIRCFLKLAGTEYFPDPEGKLLCLEAMSTSLPQLITHCASLQQMGVFERVSGVLLGNFQKLERETYELAAYDVIRKFLPENLFTAKTGEIGHGEDSRALRIGGPGRAYQ